MVFVLEKVFLGMEIFRKVVFGMLFVFDYLVWWSLVMSIGVEVCIRI